MKKSDIIAFAVRKYLYILALLLALTGAVFPLSIMLEYSPKPGSSGTYTMAVESNLTLNNPSLQLINSGLKNFITYMNFRFTNTVKAVSETGAITEAITYDDLKLEQEILGVRMPIDLGFDLKGKSFTTTVDKNGNLVNSAGLEELAPKLRDLRLDNFFLETKPVFPKKKLKPGDGWDNSLSTKIPIGTTMVQTTLASKYRLDGFAKLNGYSCAILGLSVNTSTETVPLKKEKDYSVSVTMKGAGDGKIFYAYGESKIIAAEMTLNLDSIITTTADTGTSKLDTSQSVKMKMTLVK